MASSSISSSSNTTSSFLLSWPSEANTNTTTTTTLRDASFSSYLNSSEEAYVRSLAQASRPSSAARREKAGPQGEEEIDVFSADRYFSGSIEAHNSSSSTRKKVQQHVIINGGITDDHPRHKDLRPRTPSSRSESSWNSQTALLRRGQARAHWRRGDVVSSGRPAGGRGSRRFLSCSCCDGSSVEIEPELVTVSNPRSRGEQQAAPRSVKTSLDAAEITRVNKLRLDHHPPPDPFAFPVHPARAAGGDREAEEEEEEEEAASRKSLEVFGASDRLDDAVGSKRFGMLSSWDAIPRQQEREEGMMRRRIMNAATSAAGDDTEDGSDASSDLFEIECLSCAADPVSGPRPGPAYAPSEASVEWSVVTASAADFSLPPEGPEDASRDRPRVVGRGAALLLGCKSQKAVRVAEEAYRVGTPRRERERSKAHRRRPSSSDQCLAPPGMMTSRFQAEAARLGPAARTVSPRWSHSSHSSEVLYIQ